jgi:hypothetical protein
LPANSLRPARLSPGERPLARLGLVRIAEPRRSGVDDHSSVSELVSSSASSKARALFLEFHDGIRRRERLLLLRELALQLLDLPALCPASMAPWLQRIDRRLAPLPQCLFVQAFPAEELPELLPLKPARFRHGT